MFKSILSVLVAASLSQNLVLVKFLGICPFLGVSKRVESALSMGVAVTLVTTLATLVCYPLYTLVLLPLDLGYLEIILFTFVIAALVQILERLMQKFLPALYAAMGIYLPLITTNCAVLGVAELVIGGSFYASIGLASAAQMNLGYALLYALCSGVGFTLAMVLMGGVRERVERLPVARGLRGFPVTMLVACFMAMAFYVFTLIG